MITVHLEVRILVTSKFDLAKSYQSGHSPRAICTQLLDPRDPLLQSERTQGFAADPVYGRAKCLPMLGSLKT